MWKNRRTRYALLGLVTVLALLAAFRPRAVAVERTVVKRGPMSVTVDEEGRTRVRERFVVAAPVQGRLRRITLHEGDFVDAGAVMAQLVPSPLDPRTMGQAEARLRGAEASRLALRAREESARAAFDQAHRDRDRAEELDREGLQSKEARERAVFQEATAAALLAAARKETEAAAQEIVEARAALLAAASETARPSSVVPVRAPLKGTVLRVLQESDRVVAAGTPLFELGDLDALEVVAEMLSSDAVNVRPGAPMWIGSFGGASEVPGRVRRVEPSGFTKISALGVEERRVNVVGDFTRTPEGMGDGYRVEVRVVVWESTDVLLVPGSALYRSGSEWRAFVIENGRAISRTIEVAHRTSAQAEARSGLREGEIVILYPGDRVREGTRVQ